MVNRVIAVGSELILNSGDITQKFIIDDVAGIGGSCVAYSVTYYEGDGITHRGILKEYCPAYLEAEGSVRCDGYRIIVADEFEQLFGDELIRFRNTYRNINSYLSQNLSAANFHTVQLGLYEGNNTLYTLTSCDYGKSYDKINDSDLHTTLKILMSVTKAVELYHKAGFLHLDIKPKNILILDDVTDIVKLFDFDSLTPIESVRTGIVSAIPMPEDYYVPELQNFDLRNIGVHTDVFEIGAMLFCRIFGRRPKPIEMERGAKYNFDSAKLLHGVSPQARYELEALLKSTMQISRRSRYKSTEELKQQLGKLISLTSENTPYIMNLPPWQPTAYAVGRQAELTEIKRRLDNDGYVFIRGIGGLGKSELAKIFVQRYSAEYHTVQFCKYDESLSTLIAAIPVKGINDSDYKKTDDLVREKLKALHCCDSKTLIIVDNFNTAHDKLLREFLPVSKDSFKVILTTRCLPAADYYSDKVYELPKLSDDECAKLFFMKSGLLESTERRRYTKQIIDMVRSNTLILVLLAGTVKKTGMSRESIIEALDKQELSEIKSAVFHEYDYSDDDIEEYNRIYAHLTTIFSVSRLSDTEKRVLKNMSLVSQNGMPASDFIEGCSCDSISEEIIASLSAQGWVDINSKRYLSMHPIISDLIADNDIAKSDSYYSLFESICDFCSTDNDLHFSKTMGQFACALQLDRRAKNDDVEYVAMAKYTLCNLYMEMYRPKEARRCRDELLGLDQKDYYALSYIYVLSGDIEKQFGSPSAAINYYHMALELSESINDDEQYSSELYAIAGMKIAECHAGNFDYIQAYKCYKEVFAFLMQKKLTGMVGSIAEKMSGVCKVLEKNDEYEYYSEIANRAARSSANKEKSENSIRLAQITQMSKDALHESHYGDFDKALTDFERWMSEARELLGEDSPYFHDMIDQSWLIYALNGDNDRAMRAISDDLNFTAATYGKESPVMAERLSYIAMALPEITNGEFQYAIECAKRAMSICQSLNETHVYAYFMAKLALSKRLASIGKRDEARLILIEMDFDEFSGEECLSDIINNAGILLFEIGEYGKLEHICQRMIEARNIAPRKKPLAYLLMSWVCFHKGRFNHGECYMERAYDEIELMGSTPAKFGRMALYFRSIAKMHYYKGEYSEAIEQMSWLIDTFTTKSEFSLNRYDFFFERGVYYTSNAQYDQAKGDYDYCEAVLTAYNFPSEAFLTLYYDISVSYSNRGAFGNALEYLEKIAAMRPSTAEPTSHFDAAFCSNLGWVLANLGEHARGIRYIEKSIRTFEMLGEADSKEMYEAIRNLADAYDKSGNTKRYFDISLMLYEEADHLKYAGSGEAKSLIACELVTKYLDNDQIRKGYDFALSAEKRFAQLYGENSEERLELLLCFVEIFRQRGYKECLRFVSLAGKAIQQAGMKNTLYNARLVNYIGIYIADAEEHYSDALAYLEKAKQLLEQLEEDENPLYSTVVQNIEYVKDKIWDNMSDDLAQLYLNNAEEDS